jgi:hypothetical protein
MGRQSDLTIVMGVVLLLSPLSTAYSQRLENAFEAMGKISYAYLPSSPFPHPNRANGHVYRDKAFPAAEHYSDSTVGFFIPKHFRPGKTTDLVIHFHGWNNNVDSVFKQFRLVEQFAESRVNAILVIPQGPKNSPDSYGGRLEDKNGFKNFIDGVAAALIKQGVIKSKKIGKIILSGHSGGYHVISYILLRGGMVDKIKEVFLFDALYGGTERYAYWLDHYKGRLIAIYTDSGGTTYETKNLIEDLEGWGIPALSREETKATSSELRNNRIVFLHTTLGHSPCIYENNNFRDYLKASCLTR